MLIKTLAIYKNCRQYDNTLVLVITRSYMKPFKILIDNKDIRHIILIQI